MEQLPIFVGKPFVSIILIFNLILYLIALAIHFLNNEKKFFIQLANLLFQQLLVGILIHLPMRQQLITLSPQATILPSEKKLLGNVFPTP